MVIVNVRPATEAEWDDYWNRSEAATYFHSRGWATVWQKYTQGRIRPSPKMVEFTDGASVLVPLSLDGRPRSPTRRYLSSPAATYGGWLAPESLTEQNARAVIDLITSLGNVTLAQNPFDAAMERVADSVPWTNKDFTQVVDYELGLKNVEGILRKNQVLRKYRQGARAGLTLRRDETPAMLEEYARIYSECKKRWGPDATNSYHPRLFRSLDLDSQHLDFWTVHKDGRVIAAGPLFKSGGWHVVSWLTLADPEVLDTRPYDFLYYSLIHHYGELGFRYFDFNPSGGHRGVVRFKDNFGPTRRPSNTFTKTSATARIMQHLSSQIRGAAATVVGRLRSGQD